MVRSILLKSLAFCIPLWLVTPARCDNGADLIYSRKSDIKDGGHTSPDGKFVVVSHYGEAENIHITIHAKSNLKRIIYQSSSVNGFAWLPGRNHSLVFAVSSDNGGKTPGLFLWQSNKRPRLIRGIKVSHHEWPEVALLGVSRDGHKIAYEYWPNVSGVGPRLDEGPFVKSLRLP